MGAVSGALASSFKAHGGEVRTDAEVAQILVSGNRAAGVRLASGEEIFAKTVVSNLDAKRTFTRVMNPNDVPPSVLERARNFKIRGSSGPFLRCRKTRR
jgi:phytoene dehydrogenase-like protein